MSDTNTDHGQRSATGTQPTDTDRIGVQYGLLGPCVAFALLVGIGVGHYAATSFLADSTSLGVTSPPVSFQIRTARSSDGVRLPLATSERCDRLIPSRCAILEARPRSAERYDLSSMGLMFASYEHKSIVIREKCSPEL